MKKIIINAMIILGILFSIFANVNAKTGWVTLSQGTTPAQMVYIIADLANDGAAEVADTRLDGVNNTTCSWGSSSYQISNTLCWLTHNIWPYIQWLIFIGLSMATILLIWNGFLLVTARKKITDVKGNIINILVGVIIMIGFLAIIKLATAIINILF